MSADYDDTPLSQLADDKIKSFQWEASQVAGVFHHLITLPTYHTAALSTKRYVFIFIIFITLLIFFI